MNEATANLNLARKWRSKSFDQIVGQPLSVRMLKNSLYLDSYFPVYLFSGQRGCGKTTTARVFACAINCMQLAEFQKNPKIQAVPCLQCVSCKAMQAGNHPDFIEIDAASHTGVDNVRNIIDAASMLPLLGRKKIYLIDEAHMLSKSAFNAFLKILEEPPASVLFILATTDPHKIIDTVKSRCFQLFFASVETNELVNHLVHVCQTEQINYDNAGLQLIVKESDGSVRDALNMLERVRFASSAVSKVAVQQVLGHLDDERLIKLATIALSHNPAALLRYMQEIDIEHYSASFIWHKMIELMRVCMWLKYGVTPHDGEYDSADLHSLMRNCTIARINSALDSLYAHETLLTRTTQQHAVLEMILLSLCKKNTDSSDNSSGSAPASLATQTSEDVAVVLDEEQIEEEEEEDSEDQEDEAAYVKQWLQFVTQVESLQDPLLTTLFKQGMCQQYEQESHTLTVDFTKELSFFADWLSGSQVQWQPLLNKAFNQTIRLNALFVNVASQSVVNKQNSARESKPVAVKIQSVQAPAEQPAKQAPVAQSNKPSFVAPHTQWAKKQVAKPVPSGRVLDVSDKILWKKTNLILQYFPGTVREVKTGGHEQHIA